MTRLTNTALTLLLLAAPIAALADGHKLTSAYQASSVGKLTGVRLDVEPLQ